MSAIRFVVRDGTGNLQRGTVLENGDTANLNIGSSQDISLNLRRSEVASFDRQGSDLIVTLTDGSVLTLGGYFVEAGAVSNQLFLSDDGFLTEVQISEQGGNLISAYYSEAEAFGKWSADDALFLTPGDNIDFAIADAIVAEPEAGMLGTALLTGLGGIGATGASAAVAGGAALLVGGGASPSSLCNAMREFGSVREFFTASTIGSLTDIPFVFVFLALVWSIAGDLVWVLVAGGALMVIPGFFFQKRMIKLTQETQGASAKASRLLHEAIYEADTVKAQRGEERFRRV